MIERDELRAYCLGLKGTVEEFPFGEGVAVFKVMGKMYALLPIRENIISLKCDPTWAQVLRDTYHGVQPGYHLNKRHWNTIDTGDDVPDDEVFELIDHSYELVVKGLTKAQRAALEQLP